MLENLEKEAITNLLMQKPKKYNGKKVDKALDTWTTIDKLNNTETESKSKRNNVQQTSLFIEKKRRENEISSFLQS